VAPKCILYINVKLAFHFYNLMVGKKSVVGSWGERVWGSVNIKARTTTLVRETPHSYPKPQGYGFMGLFTYKVFNLLLFLFDVGHITHTCTQQVLDLNRVID